MSVKSMWQGNAITLVLLIILNLALMSIGVLPWVVLGIIVLLLGMFFSFRQGMVGGHEACGIAETVKRTMDPSSPAYGQMDKKTLKETWSVQRGVKGVLASALIPYALSCLYIISMLLKWEPVILPARLAAWVLALPFWPIIAYWYEAFDVLTPAIVAVFMISPFVLPLCTFAGYLQGPKLWAKSEAAMAQGRRRAKAKSRVAKKRTVRPQKPEI